MTCQEVLDRLSPFLDDELDALTSREVAEHLASCPGCSAERARLEELRARFRREVEYHRAPDTLRARVSARRTPAPRDSRPAWRPLAAAAAVLVVGGGVWLAGTVIPERAGGAMVNEAVSNHVRSLMATHLTDVESSDQHTVKPWFNGRLDFSPPVTDFAGAGFPLAGGRLDYLDQRPVAALVYRHRQHVINVFVWPIEDGGAEVAPAVSRRGYHLVRAKRAHMAYWLVSDLNQEELSALARMIVFPPSTGPTAP